MMFGMFKRPAAKVICGIRVVEISGNTVTVQPLNQDEADEGPTVRLAVGKDGGDGPFVLREDPMIDFILCMLALLCVYNEQYGAAIVCIILAVI